ncbi:MAG: aspartate/glutamate racemase family protein [Tissierellia bacterium]|nr:aspartate/glutamate racemase family protein [Tissierellia bacterium]
MKVGVFAGTKVDTQMGVELLQSRGFETLSYPMAATPQEQTNLQYFSKTELENLFEENARDAINKGAEKIFIYCNSLSAAIDYEKIEKNIGVPVITPLETYKKLPKDVRNVGIIAANGISAYRIDSIITQHNLDVNTISIGNLSIVESIEEGTAPEEIIRLLNLEGMIKYLEGISDPRYKVDSILLGCTHFPYLKTEIEKITNLNIIDPTEEMVGKLS